MNAAAVGVHSIVHDWNDVRQTIIFCALETPAVHYYRYYIVRGVNISLRMIGRRMQLEVDCKNNST